MIKKTISYVDFKGERVSEDFYFHLSQAELVELSLSQKGGMKEWLEEMIAAEDGKVLVETFKKILLSAYGKRSLDGRRFIKSQELRDEFEQCPAYSDLFMSLITNMDTLVEFIQGIVPDGLDPAAVEALQKSLEQDDKGPILELVGEPKQLTQREILEMSTEEFEALRDRLQKGEVKLPE